VRGVSKGLYCIEVGTWTTSASLAPGGIGGSAARTAPAPAETGIDVSGWKRIKNPSTKMKETRASCVVFVGRWVLGYCSRTPLVAKPIFFLIMFLRGHYKTIINYKTLAYTLPIVFIVNFLRFVL
jgi:hypothetical protein